jgi:hypothetical protein
VITSDDTRHGTYAGYCSGCREECCRSASREYMRKHRASKPGGYENEKMRNRARTKALWQLARLHPEQFEALYVTEVNQAKGRAA